MRNRFAVLLVLLLSLSFVLQAAYTWYFTDSFPGGVVNPTNWQLNTSPSSGGKVAISTLAVPDGTADHEVRSNLPATCPGTRVFLHLLRATSNYNDYLTGDAYRVQLRLDAPDCRMALTISKVNGINGWTQLLYLTNQTFVPGGVWRSFVRNDGPSPGVTVVIGGQQWTVNNTSLSGGKPGVGHAVYPGANQFAELPVSLGIIDRIAPSPATGLSAIPNANNIQLSWNAAVDDTNGYGIHNYELYRNGAYVGRTSQTTFNFPGLLPSQTYTLGVVAVDGHLNRATTATLNATTTALLSTNQNPRRVGISNHAASWGGMGESIDTLSGNLNYTFGIGQLKFRNGGGLPLALTYNSQNWRKTNSTVEKLGGDLGFGFGWRLLAGALTPVWIDQYTFGYYLFTDSTGAEYKLDVNSAGVWKSKDGSYLSYDPATAKLWFHSGIFWQMGAASGGQEQDAGTLYPTIIQNSNGNYLQILYAPAIGSSTANTSSRPSLAWGNDGFGYNFTYNTDSIPHLVSITGPPNSGQSRTFTYASTALTDPFNLVSYGSTTLLQTSVQTGTNLTTTLTHNAHGELTRVDLPYKGALTWAHSPFTFLGNVTIREVSSRGLIKAQGAPTVNYNLERNAGDSGQHLHTSLIVKDPSTVGAKKWTFSSANDYTRGFLTQLDETADWALATTLRRHVFTYAQDANTVPYLKATNTTLNPGTGAARESRTEQTVDLYGNVTEAKVFDFNQLTSPARTTYCQYHFIVPGQPNPHYLNRLPKNCYVSGGGSSQSLFSADYDVYPSNTLDTINGTAYWHDTPNYGTSYLTRGNITSSHRLGIYAGSIKYNLLGEVTQSTDAHGRQVNYSYSSASYFMVPTLMTPNSNPNLQTSLSWSTILSPTSSSQPNGTTVSYGYDGQNRVTQQSNSDGNYVNYSYNDAANQVTQTVNGRFTRTTVDGLGRPVRVELGDGAGVKTIADTEYDSCACTPFGKLKRQSLPYAPGGTPLWTTYVYDGLGRTLQVQAPNSAGNTVYGYSGNEVTVTDPAGRWKRYTMNGLGHLTQVNEPNPAGGADYVTNYQYTLLDQMKLVTMPRATGQGTVTQTRTFVYTGPLLTSVTQPETGTKQYFYNSGRLAYTIDAKNQRVDLAYDAYGRILTVTPKNSSGTVVACDVYNYLYDLSPNTYGRLAAIEWGNSDTAICSQGKMREEYTYSAMGRVASKTVKVTRLVGGVEKTADLTVQYAYNNWGALAQTTYPTTYTPGGAAVPGYLYNYSYDTMGRPSGTTYQVNGAASPQTLVDQVQYNVSGQLTQMRWFNLTGGGSQTETRQYNALGQMTRLTVPGQLDLEYRFSATANDGKLISQKNYITGEELEYQYDTLGRLSRAETTANSGSAPQWGLSWLYDGFGNRLQQNAIKGTVPTQAILVDPVTNRVQSHAFDANGNTTSTPAQGTMTYDVLDRLKTVASDTYAYATSNQRLWKNNDFVLWGADGQRLVTAQLAVIGSDLRFTQVAFDSYSHGRRLQVKDRLGSVGSYYPYGEAKSGTVSNADSFASYYRDSTALDYAQNRYYQHASGRFLTADPLQASAISSQPSSWNRYSYTSSDPANGTDPSGLITEPAVLLAPPNPITGGGGGAIWASGPICGGSDWLPVCVTVGGGTTEPPAAAGSCLVGDSVEACGTLTYMCLSANLTPISTSNPHACSVAPTTVLTASGGRVRIPLYAVRENVTYITGGIPGCDGTNGTVPHYLNILYQILDQFGKPFNVEGLVILEQTFSATGYYPNDGRPYYFEPWRKFGGITDKTGRFRDSPYGGCGNGSDMVDITHQSFKVHYAGIDWTFLAQTTILQIQDGVTTFQFPGITYRLP